MISLNSNVQNNFSLKPKSIESSFNTVSRVDNKRKITELLAKTKPQGPYGSAQEKAANWLLRLAGGDRSVFNEIQQSSKDVFNDSNASPLKDFLSQSSGVAGGFNLDDTYNVAITAGLKSNVLFSQRRYISYFLDILRQNVPGVESLLQSAFGLSKADAQGLAADLLTSINEKFPDLVATLNQESQRIQSTEDYLAQNEKSSKSIKQDNDQKLTKAITFGGNG